MECSLYDYCAREDSRLHPTLLPPLWCRQLWWGIANGTHPCRRSDKTSFPHSWKLATDDRSSPRWPRRRWAPAGSQTPRWSTSTVPWTWLSGPDRPIYEPKEETWHFVSISNCPCSILSRINLRNRRQSEEFLPVLHHYASCQWQTL